MSFPTYSHLLTEVAGDQALTLVPLTRIDDGLRSILGESDDNVLDEIAQTYPPAKVAALVRKVAAAVAQGVA